MSPNNNNTHFLTGGGEMGELIRSKDWSQTLLGIPGKWPQSLRTTLSIVLHSRFPMFVWWGPELVCFYNDAYRPSLGNNGKHPSILGLRAEDAWPEIWNTIKPLIEQVMSGSGATWNEDQLIPIYRNGKLEDVYWTFSYSPVIDESGEPCGVLVTCVETTEKVKTIQDIKEREDQLGFTINAAELATWDLNPATNKFIGNDRMKEWFALSPEDEIPLELALNRIVERDRQKVINAIAAALQPGSDGNYAIEYALQNHSAGTERIVMATGKALFNKDNIAYRFSGILQDITEKATARKKIEESEYRYRTLIEEATVATGLYTGKELLIQYANDMLIGFFGKDDSIIGKPLDEAVPELKGQPFLLILQEVYASGISHIGKEEKADLVVNGKLKSFYFNYTYKALRNKEGNIYGIHHMAIDVTEQVLARRRIEENETRLNLVIDASELGTWELNWKTKKIICSERYLEIFGYSTGSSLEHSDFLKHIHPADLHIRQKAFDVALNSGLLYYELRLIWNDASVHWIEVKGKLIYDTVNNPYKVLGTIRDITEEKNHREELEESEQKFRLLADSMPQLVWTGDETGNLNYFNQSVYTYSGLTAEQFQKDGWIQIVHPEDREENIRQWAHSVKTGTNFLLEHRFRRSDGEYRWQLSRAIPQKDIMGNIQMWVGTSTDIHEMKELDQQKDFFISMASHELKTPITSIKGYTQILQNKYSASEDSFLKSALAVVDKQVKRLTSLITDLLDLSKIKSGNLLFHIEKFELNQLVQEAVDEIQHISPAFKITLSKSAEAFVYADRERIGQVLTNLLTNAVKYSPASDKIEVSCLIDDGQITVFVKDFGVGINKNDHKKIFERFFRVEGKSEKTFPGFGIGLFIASEIIERSGGRIAVKSEQGKGAVFYFSLPLADEL